MTTNLDRSIKFKDGSSWEAGTPVRITVKRDRATMAILTNNKGEVRKVRRVNLSFWFNEFDTFTSDDLQEATFDGVCPSLTGASVEPDGWDSEGFPSLLLACGII